MNEALEIALKAISEKKGEDIEIFDVAEISPFMDHVVIASARNLRQNYAIAQNIKDRLHEKGYHGRFRIEGNEHSNWLLIDLGDEIIHLFTKDERRNYDLERLYEECSKTLFEEVGNHESVPAAGTLL